MGSLGPVASSGVPADDVPVADSGGFYTATDVEGVLAEIAPQLGGGGLFDAYAYIRDEQTSGTNGGGSTASTFVTRVLNTEVADPDGIVSLSSNQFTLAAGTYWIEARAPAYATDRHKVKLRNITDSSDALIGSSAYSGGVADNIQTDAVVRGRITIAGSKAFELQHYCQSTSATIGFGVATSAGVVEVYAEVEIWREA